MTSANPLASSTPEAEPAAREKLIQFIDRTSLRVESEPTIRLASGIMSRYYVDCKLALSHPEARQWIGELIMTMLGERVRSIDGIGGMELGAYPVAIAASDAVFRAAGLSIPVFVVRKTVKEHGTRKVIEGPMSPGHRVLVVEDVITTGGSTAQAIERCREAGLVVERAIAILDRMEGRDKPITVEGVELESLLRLQELPSYRG